MRTAQSFPLIAFVAAACVSGTTDLVGPPPPPPAAMVTLRFVADPEDTASSAALGWQTGIPSAEVTVTPSGGGPSSRLITSAVGAVELVGVAPGDYAVELVRWLTGPESALLGPTDDALGFLGSATVRVGVDGGTQTIVVPADRRKSVVISEWAFNPEAYNDGLVAYPYGGFLELYNNADTTVHLDGLIVAEGFASQFDYPVFHCDQAEVMELDPAGVWARFFQQVPGRGMEHPLKPGEAAVIATDGIDHARIVATGLDLTTADFEFQGFSDADNPSVLNMVDIGLGPSLDGHGLTFSTLGLVPFVSLPVDPATLPTAAPGTAAPYARFPAEKLLDVMAIGSARASGYQECPRIVNARFDRRRIELFSARADDGNRSYQRRVALVGPNGRKILRHTRTSADDFEVGDRNPHAVP